MLGESRAVLKVLQVASIIPQLHSTTIANLEDDMGVSGAFAKGRSSVWSVNYLCRKRAALTLATAIYLHLPWVETSLQPADALSRQGCN